LHVDEHTIELAGVPVFFRSAPAAGTPAVYLHGLPTSSDDWDAPLARTGGIAPDLLGFGRSAKGGNLEFSVPGLADAVLALLDHLEIAAADVVGHQWGARVARELAATAPDRVRRLVLISPRPRETRLTRLWRTPVLGELTMGSTTRGLLIRALRRGSSTEAAWPKARARAVWRYFDQGTQRAILRLYRSDPPDAVEPPQPALVLQGADDPYSEPDPGARAIAGAGHWPWLDRPEETIRLISAFLQADGP